MHQSIWLTLAKLCWLPWKIDGPVAYLRSSARNRTELWYEPEPLSGYLDIRLRPKCTSNDCRKVKLVEVHWVVRPLWTLN